MPIVKKNTEDDTKYQQTRDTKKLSKRNKLQARRSGIFCIAHIIK